MNSYNGVNDMANAESSLDKQIRTLMTSTGKLRDQLELESGDLSDQLVRLEINEQINLADKCAKGRASLQPEDDHDELDKRDCLRLLKVAIKAGKCSLDMKDSTRAESVLGDAAKYMDDSEIQISIAIDIEVKKVVAEYWTLRIALSWEQKNLPTANFMFSKASTTELRSFYDARLCEEYCEILYKVGKGLYDQKEYEDAITWLTRAMDMLDETETSLTQARTEDLMLSVMQYLVRALLLKSDQADKVRARKLASGMLNNWPSKLAVQCLNIDVLNAKNSGINLIKDGETKQAFPEPPPSMYMQVSANNLFYWPIVKAIIGMINDVPPSDDYFKTVINQIHNLCNISWELAIECLDVFIVSKLLETGNETWIEQAFSTRIWICIKTSASPPDNSLPKLQSLLDEMSKNLAKPLSPKATYACQLLWKRSEVFLQQKYFAIASGWCKVALHQVFDQKGELNSGKISRRIISCAIENQDYGTAQEVYQNMGEVSRNSAITQLLMFKVDLRSSKYDHAKTILSTLSESNECTYSMLYACALEAQGTGNKDVTLEAFNSVLQKFSSAPMHEMKQMPVIYRCTIRLVIDEIRREKIARNIDLDNLCSLFEGASTHAKEAIYSSDDSMFSPKDLVWFYRNAYNLALEACEEWQPQYSSRLAKSCIMFIKCYPQDGNASVLAELNLRSAFCSFICASVATQLARKEDNIEVQMQIYREMRMHVSFFREQRLLLGGYLPDTVEPDLNKRLSILIAYDFEACIKLNLISELDKIIGEAEHLQKSDIFQILADMVLCSNAPSETILNLLQKIINASCNLNPANVRTMARWIRCLVQLSMVSDMAVAEKFIQTVVAMSNQEGDKKYPNDELEWLVATVWNFTVDKNCAGDLGGSKKWADHALSLAGQLNDGGAMLRQFQSKYTSMKF